ncbi:MAG: hypothetical protein EAX96_09020 [Candidatus Lokiarchaeota archaeon]|nr:hypothetical protein [Candidatus Lokiarchaeota archaeon]
MELVPIITSPLRDIKVTLKECEILLTIDGKKTLNNLINEFELSKFRIYLMLKKFQKKGILKLVRRIRN